MSNVSALRKCGLSGPGVDATARLATNPNDDQALNARALARMRLGRNKDAYEDLKRALSLKPDNSDYQANLGYVLWKLGRPKKQ